MGPLDLSGKMPRASSDCCLFGMRLGKRDWAKFLRCLGHSNAFKGPRVVQLTEGLNGWQAFGV